MLIICYYHLPLSSQIEQYLQSYYAGTKLNTLAKKSKASPNTANLLICLLCYKVSLFPNIRSP